MDGHKKIMNEEQVIDLASEYQANVLIPEEEEDDEPESAETIKYMQEDLDFLQDNNKSIQKRVELADDILNSVAIDIKEIV